MTPNIPSSSGTLGTQEMSLIKEGYLVKEGLHRKSWKKRWFTLNENSLSYSKAQVLYFCNTFSLGLLFRELQLSTWLC